MISAFSGQNSVSLALLHSVLQGQICLLLRVFLDFLLLHSSPYDEKDIFSGVFVLEGLVGLHRTIQLQLLQRYCSHEIKRHLLLGRKVMTNLDSILKSRDITLPTKVHLVKAVVFLVVMYGCESWTIQKAEH